MRKTTIRTLGTSTLLWRYKTIIYYLGNVLDKFLHLSYKEIEFPKVMLTISY